MVNPRVIAARRERMRDDSLAWAVDQIGQMRRQGSPQQFNRRDSAFSAFRCPESAKLATTTGTAVLPPAVADGGRLVTPTINNGNFVDVLRSEAGESWSRGVHLWSRANENTAARASVAPFDAIIDWTSGGGFSGSLEVTASGGGVSVFLNCITLTIRVANWIDATNAVICTVEDGWTTQTQDLHKVVRNGNLAAGAVVNITVPPYARYVSVATDVPAERPLLECELLDTAGSIMASVSAASFNEIWLGAASTLRLRNTNPAVLGSFLCDFRLGWN